MKTVSINVMNLCVPCENRCRYCLLSYDGKTNGVDFLRSTVYAQHFLNWIEANRPDISFHFGFGYSMEHPHLSEAIAFCQSIGSATGEFLQFDGMKFRSDAELFDLLSSLKSLGIQLIDLTFYGTEEYHDRFAARSGDYQLMMNTLKIANRVGLDVSVSIPLSQENASQIDDLLSQLDNYHTTRITCFVPHGEGRGRLLNPVRYQLENYELASSRVKSLLNRDRFRTEAEWLNSKIPEATRRVLTLTLTSDNVNMFEHMDFAETIAYLEKLDDQYYQTVPSFSELAKIYGNPKGHELYSFRDLYMHYQRKYLADRKITIYDVNDERQCFSRRI
jgi:sulfatase maturation enzyme AslB (radical SAM superfamily)